MLGVGSWVARRISGWLDRRGLANVADTLDRQAAEQGDADSLHAMAKRAMDRQDWKEAMGFLQKALSSNPDDSRLLCGLGAAHRQQAHFEEARQAYLRALELRPDYVQVLSNLGELSIAQAQYDEALEWLNKALTHLPNFFEARVNKTAVLFEQARYDEALALAERLVEDEPLRAEAHLNLGNVYVHTGKARRGIKHYRKALELVPGYPEAHFNLASFLGSKEDLVQTISYLERRVRDRGESVQDLGLLASAQHSAGNFSKAEALCERILSRQPDNRAALITLGSCLSSCGDSAGALAMYERVLQADPTQTAIGSNILFESNYISAPPSVHFDRHLAWANWVTASSHTSSHTALDRTPQRKLRIGYVSGDFKSHPVGFLLRDILPRHRKDDFEVHCFSMVVQPKDVLPELREAAHAWEEIFLLSDDEVVALVEKAGIDILVDLSGHTAFHRLTVFARKPAPIQVEWIGYFHSTGMPEIDYFITDPHTSPPGSGQLFSETPVYLPHTRFCYGPPAYAVDVFPPPSQTTGIITFGSFNRLPKMTDEVVLAWSRVLQSVPGSRLVIKSGAFSEPVVEERVRARFGAHGIHPDRLDLRQGSSHAHMLSEYGDIDIALDTFPFNGGMTTLEALWMGVPVVTIAGNTVVSRQTVSALANLGLAEELAFDSVQTYVDGAVSLARDSDRLAQLRQGLRPRMAASPLRDAETFTRDLEALYRRMWVAWCAGEKLESDLLQGESPGLQVPDFSPQAFSQTDCRLT